MLLKGHVTAGIREGCRPAGGPGRLAPGVRQCASWIADDLQLTEAEREQQIPSEGTPLIANRVHWAKTYLTSRPS